MQTELGIYPESGQLEITEAEFLRFRDYFYRKTGIHFESSKRYFVDKRLIQRIKASGHEAFRDYFTFLRFQASGEELQAVTNLMTVNETYFFREDYQFECMVKSVLGEIVRNKPKDQPIRIWSVPSSTGEEAYSIAFYLLEYWPGINSVDVEINASDIDSNVLARAREGLYSERSVKGLPNHLLRKYFTITSEGKYQIIPDLRDTVRFSKINLTSPSQTRGYRNYDLIFCRNLLIYFDDASRRQTAEILFDALRPGGFLFLGHSESMSRISSIFTVRRFPEAIAYQKNIT